VNNWKEPVIGALTGAVAGIAFGLAGFFLAQIPSTHAMGPVMFLLVPLAAGVAISMVATGRQQFWASAILATIISLATLIAFHLESLLCVVLALPWLAAGLAIGIGLGHLLRKAAGRLANNDHTVAPLVFVALPLMIWAGHRTEVSTLIHPRREIVVSTVRLPAEAAKVWSDLRAFDSLEGQKPMLMYIGLPVPERCTTQGSGLGSKRTCYFDHGFIEETVTDWSPPERMGLSIDRTDLPGRHWLGFENAEYDLKADGSATVLTRTTTIISNLYPAWYWRPFERWGVSSEHSYIFGDLALREHPAASPQP
jgi:hypothetical protein